MTRSEVFFMNFEVLQIWLKAFASVWYIFLIEMETN